MKTITREQLEQKRENDEDFTLVNVLTTEQFEQEHIPDSVNIPMDQAENVFPDRFDSSDDIVVYCASETCQASPKAAKKLEAMGFTNVKDYEGGLADWKDAGLPTASA
jgi:rhodanese-related sulfurtransferase